MIEYSQCINKSIRLCSVTAQLFMCLSKVFVLFVVFSLFAAQCFSENKAVKVATDTWLDYTNKDGSGYYYDLLHTIYSTKGIEVSVEHMPYSRGMLKLRRGEVDILLGGYKGEFDDAWYAQLPVDIDNIDVAVSKELNAEWRGEESLQGKRIVAAFGNDFDQFYNIDASYMELRDIDAMLKMLMTGRVDAVLNYRRTIRKSIDDLNAKDIYIKESVFQQPIYFIFNQTAKSKAYKAIFDTEMEKLVESGAIKKMLQDYFGEDVYYPDYEKYKQQLNN